MVGESRKHLRQAGVRKGSRDKTGTHRHNSPGKGLGPFSPAQGAKEDGVTNLLKEREQKTHYPMEGI